MARGIDHLVIAVRDLDAAAVLYGRLGFQVGPQNRHPWGTLNRIVQLDGAFLELITTEPGFVPPAPEAPVAPFAGFLADYLQAHEGLAMLVLASDDAPADHARLVTHGIAEGAPFFFERKGRRADGSEVQVAFTLAFARPRKSAPAGFFLCQHHFPEHFWSPQLQHHANTAQAVTQVVAAASRPEDVAAFLAAFADAPVGSSNGELVVDTGRGVIEIAGSHSDTSQSGGSESLGWGGLMQLVAFRVACRDIVQAGTVLEAAGVPFTPTRHTLHVPATFAGGTAIVFDEERREQA